MTDTPAQATKKLIDHLQSGLAALEAATAGTCGVCRGALFIGTPHYACAAKVMAGSIQYLATWQKDIQAANAAKLPPAATGSLDPNDKFMQATRAIAGG